MLNTYSLKKEVLSKLEEEMNFHNLITCSQSYYPVGETLDTFLSRLVTRQECPLLQVLLKILTEV